MKTPTPSSVADRLTTNLYAHYARSLIIYAASNKQFAALLLSTIASYLKQHGAQTNPSPRAASAPQFLTQPDSETTAQNRLAWLMHELTVLQADTQREARSLLLTYYKQHQEPKAAVIGIVGIAIIGPTLGIVKRRRKRKSKLTIVVNERFDTLSNESAGTLTIAAGSKLVSEQLLALHGDASRLEPELAEWFFADRITEIVRASEAELAAMEHTMTIETLPYAKESDGTGAVAIALSPTVNTDLLLHQS